MNRRLFLSAALLLAPVSQAVAAGDGGDKKKTGGESYVPIPPVRAYTVRPGQRRGVMSVDCGLEIPDAALRQRAELMLPRLRAAYVQVVQIYAGGLPAGAPPSPDFLARNLQRSTDEVLGRKGAKVLMGAVVLN